MITKSIKAPSLIQRVFEGWRRPHTPLQQQPHRLTPNVPKLGKREFAQFVEKTRQTFKVGDLVTQNHFPESAHPPTIFYRVEYIQELWYDCEYDTYINEPRCLSLFNVMYKGPLFNVCPSRYRVLTEKELEGVDVQYKTSYGSAS